MSRPPDRRAVLGGLAAAVAGPAAQAAQAYVRAPPPAFLVIGDWGRGGSVVQRQVAAAMGRAAAEVGGRFVISVGDNFYPHGVRSIYDPQWRSSFEQVYADAALQIPWRPVLGNHDYRGVARAQIAYSALSRRWRMPAPYFKLAVREPGFPGLDIFFIDTTSFVRSYSEAGKRLLHGRLPGTLLSSARAQKAWLEAELGRSAAPWKIVVGHHPVHSGAHKDIPELVGLLDPILQSYGVQAYLNGHDHDLQHIRRHGTDYVCSGSGSTAGPVWAVPGTRFCQSRPGFAVLRFWGDRLALEFRDLHGQTLHRAWLEQRRERRLGGDFARDATA